MQWNLIQSRNVFTVMKMNCFGRRAQTVPLKTALSAVSDFLNKC